MYYYFISRIVSAVLAAIERNHKARHTAPSTVLCGHPLCRFGHNVLDGWAECAAGISLEGFDPEDYSLWERVQLVVFGTMFWENSR